MRIDSNEIVNETGEKETDIKRCTRAANYEDYPTNVPVECSTTQLFSSPPATLGQSRAMCLDKSSAVRTTPESV